MAEPLEQAIIQAATHVFETAAYFSAWPFSEEDGELPQPDIAAVMIFSGPFRGRLVLRVAEALMGILTQNMIGDLEEGDSPDEKGRDALKEVLNMICGNVLTFWQGEDPVFNLSPPEILIGDAPEMPVIERAEVPFCVEYTLATVSVEKFSEAAVEAPAAGVSP